MLDLRRVHGDPLRPFAKYRWFSCDPTDLPTQSTKHRHDRERAEIPVVECYFIWNIFWRFDSSLWIPFTRWENSDIIQEIIDSYWREGRSFDYVVILFFVNERLSMSKTHLFCSSVALSLELQLICITFWHFNHLQADRFDFELDTPHRGKSTKENEKKLTVRFGFRSTHFIGHQRGDGTTDLVVT